MTQVLSIAITLLIREVKISFFLHFFNMVSNPIIIISGIAIAVINVIL